AQIVIDNWRHFDGDLYDIVAYTVMPNHVHILIKTFTNWSLSKVIHSWKSYSSHQILVLENDRRAAGAPDKLNNFWQREYWDRFIRDEKHFHSAINYILNNPVNAGLVQDSKKWPYSYVSNHDFTGEPPANPT
ncbi:MAG: transposase, partial [Lentisphaeraceae bacterium]|nr:transposase [Lentisphaeraceae bacterium]